MLGKAVANGPKQKVSGDEIDLPGLPSAPKA
jgi:hypothetical protein